MNRKSFLKIGLGAAAATQLIPIAAHAQDTPPPLKMELVKEFVIAGHGKPEKVLEMLSDHPNLVYCRYDWGNGDFEEAIEGAGHLGNKSLAELLIKHGARVNLFVLTMLGKSDLVLPVLDQYPELIFAKGAHGFTLLHHAKVGGKESEKIVQYLDEKGLKETNIRIR
jgi:hypothetical protein